MQPVTYAEPTVVAPDTYIGQRTYLDALLELVGNVRGLEIADIGCSEGSITGELAVRGVKMTGIDPHLNPVVPELLGEFACRLLSASSEALPIASESIDLVLFIFSLHHITSVALPKSLGEALRNLAARWMALCCPATCRGFGVGSQSAPIVTPLQLTLAISSQGLTAGA